MMRASRREVELAYNWRGVRPCQAEPPVVFASALPRERVIEPDICRKATKTSR